MVRGEIIDGRAMAKTIRLELKKQVEERVQQGVQPGLAVVLVGEDPASQTYVRGKVRACEEVGIHSQLIHLPKDTAEADLLVQIDRLNQDASIHGILVQLPLPPQIAPERVIAAIHPNKDVDGFHPVQAGRLLTGLDAYLPCTPHGILQLLKRTGITLDGMHAVVVGRSNIVGKPVSLLLQRENATVTMCHSRTRNLPRYTRQADILIAAVGRYHLIGADHVKEGAVVIDVGMNRSPEGKLAGDVDFAAVRPLASHITPVPGGVGPMTIAMLLHNTLVASEKVIPST